MANNYIEKKNWFFENTNKRGRILEKIPPPWAKREKDWYPVCPSSVFLLSSQVTARLFPPKPPWIFSVFSRCLNTLSFLAASFSILLQEWWEGSCEEEAIFFCLCCVLLRSYCFHFKSWGFLGRYVHAHAHAAPPGGSVILKDTQHVCNICMLSSNLATLKNQFKNKLARDDWYVFLSGS